MKRASWLAFVCLVVPSAIAAQSVAPPPSTAAITIGPTAPNVLRTGTAIQLRIEEALTTEAKVLRVGQHFQLTVAEPLLVAGQTIIPAGTPAVGEITEVRNKGMWGKSGHLTASLLYVSINGRQIRLNGTFDDKGVTGTAGVVAAVALVPVVGFFTTGTSARIPVGAQVKGFIGEDVPLVFSEPAPAKPLVVPVSPAPTGGAAAPVPQSSQSVPIATTPAAAEHP